MILDETTTTIHRPKVSNDISNKNQTAFYRNVILPSKISKEKSKVRSKDFSLHSISFNSLLVTIKSSEKCGHQLRKTDNITKRRYRKVDILLGENLVLSCFFSAIDFEVHYNDNYPSICFVMVIIIHFGNYVRY